MLDVRDTDPGGCLMSTLTAGLIAAGVTVAGLLLLVFGLCRAAGRPYPVEETRGRRVWDETAEQWITLPYGVQPGPDQLTEAEVDVRDRCQLLISELDADPLNPRWDAGCERLWDAIRDEQNQKGEA